MEDKLKREIQKFLGLTVDGQIGPISIKAISSKLSCGNDIKSIQKAVGVIADGELGPVSYQAIVTKLGIKIDVSNTTTDTNWPKQDYNSMVKFYGNVGENQTTLILPYEMYLAWEPETKVHKISCHKKIHDSLERIFEKTLNHYGIDKIKELRLDSFGGCLNVRKMRGGSSWSIHSWGAAIDLDPDRNQLKWGKDKAVFAKPEYTEFWKIVEGEGATSLGRSRNMDWMHLQFADL